MLTEEKQRLSRDVSKQSGMASDNSCELTSEILITALLDQRVIDAFTEVISRAINNALDKPTAPNKPDSRAITNDDLPMIDSSTCEPSNMMSQSTATSHFPDALLKRCMLPDSADRIQGCTTLFSHPACHCLKFYQREEVYKSIDLSRSSNLPAHRDKLNLYRVNRCAAA